MFNLKSKDQVEAILKKTERLTSAALKTSKSREEFSEYIQSYEQKKQQMIERSLKQCME